MTSTTYYVQDHQMAPPASVAGQCLLSRALNGILAGLVQPLPLSPVCPPVGHIPARTMLVGVVSASRLELSLLVDDFIVRVESMLERQLSLTDHA